MCYKNVTSSFKIFLEDIYMTYISGLLVPLFWISGNIQINTMIDLYMQIKENLVKSDH